MQKKRAGEYMLTLFIYLFIRGLTASDAQHTTRRDGRRRDRWEHRHWLGPCVSVQRLQMCDIHARHSGALPPASIARRATLTRRRRLTEPREDRPPAHARRRGTPRSRGPV